MISIAEIFGPTIQGEGPDVGLKSIFLRVAGCDFNCSWCDSKFAWNITYNTQGYEEESLAENLVNMCNYTNCKSIILTGGNPCLYDFTTVVKILKENDIRIGVETQGSILPRWLEYVDNIVISPKPPSSKQADVFENVKNFILNNLEKNIAIKIPIFDDEDFEFATKYYEAFEDKLNDNIRLYLSVGNCDTSEPGAIRDRIIGSYEKLINKVNTSSLSKVYILPQVHTLVWGNKQGV